MGHDLVEQHLSKNPLLAKWRREDEDFSFARGISWSGHMQEVLWGLDVLFTEPFFGGKRKFKSFAHALHYKMKLPCSFRDFRKWAFLACLGHDLGKCGGEFQQMLVGMEVSYLQEGGPPGGYASKADAEPMRDKKKKFWRHQQAYRHEFLSALLIFHHPEIRDWFQKAAGSDEGLAYILGGVFGHHTKGQKAFRHSDFLLKAGFQNLPVYTDKLSVGMNKVLGKSLPSWAGKVPAFPTLGRLKPDNTITKSAHLEDRLDDMHASPLFQNADHSKRGDDKVSVAIKWTVILADIFGSIDGESGGGGVRKHILESVKSVWGPVQVDYAGRIQRRLGKMGKGSKLWPFQKRCKLKYKSLILTPPTGKGKTLGVFSWASGDPSSPLIHCTPTTGTASCLHEDYADKGDWLRHTKAWFDIKYRTTPGEDEGPALKKSEDLDEEQGVIDMLRGSDRDVMFVTADQVLGLLAFYYRSVGLLPFILKSQVSFDEVASYDPTMLGYLDKFLRFFPRIRTAHVSATLPAALETRLTTAMRTTPKIERGSPSTLKRFRIHVVSEKEAAAKFDFGTLWFVNVVARAQEIARARPEVACYHSRFKYEDRLKIRVGLVKDFKEPRPTSKVVATQAAEVSFDISALRLISEISPIASMIQRLGRVNRQGEHGISDVYFYLPTQTSGLPYVASKGWETTYEEWRDWLLQFKGLDVSQDDLERAFQVFYAKLENQDRQREIFSSLLQTSRGSVRHAIHTSPCLLEADVLPFTSKGQQMSREEVLKKSVPVPLYPKDRNLLDARKSKHQRTYVIDPSYGTYDARLGFLQKMGPKA